MNFFVIILLWQHILYVVSHAGRQVDLPPCTRNNVHKYRICCHNDIIMEKFIFLTRDFSYELYVLPDDDKRYAIETCRSSESVLKK